MFIYFFFFLDSERNEEALGFFTFIFSAVNEPSFKLANHTVLDALIKKVTRGNKRFHTKPTLNPGAYLTRLKFKIALPNNSTFFRSEREKALLAFDPSSKVV